MNRILKPLYLFLIVSILASCSEDKVVDNPVSNDKIVVLDRITNTANFDFGGASFVKFQNELPDWLSYEEVDNNGVVSVDFTAADYTTVTRKASLTALTSDNRTQDILVVQNAIAQKGLYILSAGDWNTSTSDLAYYDELTGTIIPNYFSKQNGRTLGDLGNDMAIYGSKIYVVVSGSNPDSKNNFIEVIDPKNAKSIKQIPFIINKADNTFDSPRNIVFEGGKGYITGYSGIVARLDTVSLELDAFAKLNEDAKYSEGIAYLDKKLYVANSGQGRGKTISVLSVDKFEEIGQIEVAQNPVNIAADNGKLYFQTSSVYGTDIPSNLFELDPLTQSVTKKFDIRAGKLAILDGILYTGDYIYEDGANDISKLNIEKNQVVKMLFDSADLSAVNSFDVNPLTKEIYIGSQADNFLILDSEGRIVKDLSVGVKYISRVVGIFR